MVEARKAEQTQASMLVDNEECITFDEDDKIVKTRTKVDLRETL